MIQQLVGDIAVVFVGDSNIGDLVERGCGAALEVPFIAG